MAVKYDNGQLKYNLNTGDRFIAATYGISFFVFVVALIVFFIFVWSSDSVVKVILYRLYNEHQTNMVAAIGLCGVLTAYTIGLDIIAFTKYDMPDYYYKREDFLHCKLHSYLYIYGLVFLVPVLWLIIYEVICVECVIKCCECSRLKIINSLVGCSTNIKYLEDDDVKSTFNLCFNCWKHCFVTALLKMGCCGNTFWGARRTVPTNHPWGVR